MSETLPPRRRHALAGALGGALGAALAGALGGAFGGCIEAMAPPESSTILPNALAGAGAWGLAGAAFGAVAGCVIGPRCGGRTAFDWPLAAAFLSALVGSVELAQVDLWSAAQAFALGMVLLLALFAVGPWIGRALWKLRWLLLAWLAVCLAGEAYRRLWPKTFTDVSSQPEEPVVQLGYCRLPGVLGAIAAHPYFLSFDPAEGRWHRWDLWQYPNRGGPDVTSWSHVHRDLLGLRSGTGGGPPWVEREWRGNDARAILGALARSDEYPYRDKYLAWPGPNSCTYPAWVLRQAGVSADMDPRAIGRNYHGRAGVGRTTTATGIQAESSLLGVQLGLEDGLECHLLCFTAGVDAWPPAVKTPFGRIGFAE
jgi:hypothetical protein